MNKFDSEYIRTFPWPSNRWCGAVLPEQPDKYEVALALAHMLIEKWMTDLPAEKVTSLVMDIATVIP